MSMINYELVRSQVIEISKKKDSQMTVNDFLSLLRQQQIQPQIITLVGKYLLEPQLKLTEEVISSSYQSH